MPQARTISIVITVILAIVILEWWRTERLANDPVELPANSGLTAIPDDDPKMLAAIKQARETLDQFIVAFQNPQPSRTKLSIKMQVSDGTNIEHMWIVPVSYSNAKFRGTLMNNPYNLKGIVYGQELECSKEQVSDWVYVENGKLIGGYTMNVIRDSLSPEERLEYDRSTPFKGD